MNKNVLILCWLHQLHYNVPIYVIRIISHIFQQFFNLSTKKRKSQSIKILFQFDNESTVNTTTLTNTNRLSKLSTQKVIQKANLTFVIKKKLSCINFVYQFILYLQKFVFSKQTTKIKLIYYRNNKKKTVRDL